MTKRNCSESINKTLPNEMLLSTSTHMKIISLLFLKSENVTENKERLFKETQLKLSGIWNSEFSYFHILSVLPLSQILKIPITKLIWLYVIYNKDFQMKKLEVQSHCINK